MSQVDNISFKLNSTFDGTGKYFIYNSSSCEGDLVLSGSTNIINGTSTVNINQPLNLNQNISIQFIDSKKCDVCEDYEITTTTTTTTSTTTTTTTLEPQFNTYYLAQPRSVNDLDNSGCVDTYDYCVEPGFTTVTTVYANTIDTTLEQLLNTILYIDTSLTIPFEGIGSDFRYAVSTTSGLNTFIAGPTGYRLITVDENGFVLNIEVNSCDCEENGGGPIV